MNDKRIGKPVCLSLFLFLFFWQSAYSQISGVVTSADEDIPLIGVNILIKNTSRGTITDYEGKYELDATPGEVLIFSYTGYVSQEITLSGETTLNIRLLEQAEMLDEIVVVGYGSMRKSDVTGSIVSVRDEALTDVRSGNVLEALQGRIAGVDITRDDGRAGSDVDLLIRGERSLRASNSPLILVDGIPYGDNIDLSPEDIESIEILKDASSTAIYGSRGANGVLLITTKRGVEGKSRVHFNSYYGVAEPFQKVPVYDRAGYIQAKIDAKKDIYAWDVEPNIQNAFLGTEVFGVENDVFTDWQDLITRQGSQQNYHLGFDGSTKKFSYATSLSYYNEEGVVLRDAFERFTFRLNLDAKINSYFRIGSSSILAYKYRDGIGPRFTDAIRSSPIVEAYDSLGNYLYQPNFANPRKSPLAQLLDEQEEKDMRIFNTFYAEIEPLKGLTFRTNVNVDVNTGFLGFMYPQKAPAEGMTTSGVDLDLNYGYLWNNIVSYTKDFGIHRLTATAVHEVQYDRDEFYGIDGQAQQFDRSLWYNLGTNSAPTTESNLQEKALVSFLGRVNYSLLNRYVFSVSGRYDGASQLSPGNKWDFFPSASFAWRVTEEPFMSHIPFVSDMKIRFGYGVTGNASIDPYSTASSLNINPLYYEFGEPGAELPAFSYRPVALASSGLKWERTRQSNLGLDLGLFNNRLAGSLDLFSANTDRLLLQDQLPPTSGFDNVYINAGETESWGWEVNVQSVNLDFTHFEWTTQLSYFGSREKIVALTSGLTEDEGNLWFVGYPISVYYDFEKVGIWQFGEEEDSLFTAPGEIKVKDVNGDGKIDFEDRVVLGTPRPKWSGSLINTFRAFGFDLTINIFAKMGQLVDAGAYDYDPRMYDNMIAVDYWTPENPTNAYPRYDASRAELPYESTLSYVDGSYIKIKNITLGYTLPDAWMKQGRFTDLRLYVSGKNTAILYSNMYEGMDPEREGSINYPLARLWLFGINASF